MTPALPKCVTVDYVKYISVVKMCFNKIFRGVLNRDFEIDDYFLKICIEYVLQLKSTAAKSN